jgi:HrpA-like helicases
MTPEILRVDLAETALSLRQLGYDPARTFPWFETPAPAALQSAHELLQLLGAIDSKGVLTQAGKDMSGFPMHPRLARLLLEAGKHKCVRLATFTAALLSERSALAGKPDFPEEVYRQEIASDFYGQFCLLEKISASGFDPASCTRYAVNAGAAKNVLRTQALFLQHCRRTGFHPHDDVNAPRELARCLLLAYPDHLAVRRDKGTLICALRDNRHGVLARESIARTAQILVASDIRETKGNGREIKTILSLATEIKEEWLHEHFEQEFRTESTCEWNSSTMSVENRTRTLCLGVVLSESLRQNDAMDHAGTLVAETIIAKKLKLPFWDQSVEDWIRKVQWVAGQFPEQKLPVFNEEDRNLIIHDLCEGEYRFDTVCAKPVLPFAQKLLDAKQHRFVEAMAPQTIGLPSGRKLRIFYDPKTGPRARTRIQDLYGMNATPRVADGRVAVLIEVLAPNNRPVQITHDLANFWAVHYPQLKNSLSRRYPRHEWR